jgi:BirA family biotin operon repressor/biotin-[acetyl-CoA-carboxylase] ligase
MPPRAIIARQTLSIDVIRQQLATRTIGRRIVLHEVVASTNASLRELADAGALEGTVVLAESQTAGRGRGQKTWFSPPGVNLYASILFRPPIAAAAAPGFAFIAPLALVDSIRELGVKAGLKWPNDVLVRNRKVAGVRAEMTAHGDAVEYIVLGVGVNLNVTHKALRTGLGETGRFATSLREALGRAVDRNAFTARFLTCLEERLDTYQAKGAAAILAGWRDVDVVTGRWVEVREGPTFFAGRALGVDTEGHLQVKDTRKRVHTVVAGEIRLVQRA